MADLVNVVIEDKRWRELRLGRLAQEACKASLCHLQLRPSDFEIDLLGCNDARITILNGDFRQKLQATNVLSWPSHERAPENPGEKPKLPSVASDTVEELGDIAIAYETCWAEAEQAGKPQDQHVRHLLVHATLHLLGYDHIVKQDAVLMEDLERQVLATMGYPDPYGFD